MCKVLRLARQPGRVWAFCWDAVLSRGHGTTKDLEGAKDGEDGEAKAADLHRILQACELEAKRSRFARIDQRHANEHGTGQTRLAGTFSLAGPTWHVLRCTFLSPW